MAQPSRSRSGMLAVCSMMIWWFHSAAAADINSNSNCSVMKYGAKADGKTESSRAFGKAWACACGSQRAATMYVPKGRFLIKPVQFSGPCRNRVTVRIDGTLVAPSDFWDMGNSGFWILFIKVSGLAVYGGTLDAKGPAFWACRRSGNSCPVGARVRTYAL